MEICRWNLAFIAAVVFAWTLVSQSSAAQSVADAVPTLILDQPASEDAFVLFSRSRVTPIILDNNDAEPVLTAAESFAKDIQRVSGRAASVRQRLPQIEDSVIIVGTLEGSSFVRELVAKKKIDVSAVQGGWESALITKVDKPLPGVKSALVIAGADARGTAFALFDLSRAMGVSPWYWWADVPIKHHESASFPGPTFVQRTPAVQYRGIFLNDEDWGLRPWAAKRMDKSLRNIGPMTYGRICELLVRLHANTLWPAMHPGSMPFHAISENAKTAKRWGVVMGSSHSEALLRNNVGEWDEGRDGAWNYQVNRDRMRAYWAAGLIANGAYENIYTIGLRGQHDSGLEATGTLSTKARLVEQVISDQRALLKTNVNPIVEKIPQVVWLYKESIDLYRAGMKIPEDVTLGWTDDNHGYLRQLPNAQERLRPGGSALYYHVSYWGTPHDYLWLCSTPPVLMQEELSKAWDHGVRKLWMLNVGDIKPAEQDIDYFLRMAWQAPAFRAVSQHDFMLSWYKEQFGESAAPAITALMENYYHLNFIRRPEFMGFNGYTDEVQRTGFNPLAWGDQNRQRRVDWENAMSSADKIETLLGQTSRDAYFELVKYPVDAAGQQNLKFLWTDRSYLDQHNHDSKAVALDSARARHAYERIQQLTTEFGQIRDGKWTGIVSWHPRDRRVFEMPETGEVLSSASVQLPSSWVSAARPDTADAANEVVALSAARFSKQIDTPLARWEVWPALGLGSGSVTIRDPGKTAPAPWTEHDGTQDARAWSSTPYIEYSFVTARDEVKELSLFLLPTFPIDSDSHLRHAVSLDGKDPVRLDAAGGGGKESTLTPWESNVLRGAMIEKVNLGRLSAGRHALRLYYGDPAVVFEYLTVGSPNLPPAYPFPPETDTQGRLQTSSGSIDSSR